MRVLHRRRRPGAQRPVAADQGGGRAQFNGRVQVPFWFLDAGKLADKLNLFDDGATIWWIATGEHTAPPPRPYDPLTSWVALAIVGGLEQGGPCLEPRLDREARLKLAGDILSDEELLIVETIAVPKRYRCLPALELEDMIRTASSYVDRLWAACWLTLTGWTESHDCSFQDISPTYPSGELNEAVRAAYAREHGVANDADLVGTARIGQTREACLIHERLLICETHYGLNGPPPHEHTRHTIPSGQGWRRIVHVVPDSTR